MPGTKDKGVGSKHPIAQTKFLKAAKELDQRDILSLSVSKSEATCFALKLKIFRVTPKKLLARFISRRTALFERLFFWF